MAIDPLREDLILPREATKLFPNGPNGKRIHISAIYRFMSVGVRGVILESLNAPQKCTSRQAVARFLGRLSNPSASTVHAPSTSDRLRTNREAEKELDRLGI